MANPNINTPTSAFANNALLALTATTETLLVANAANSNRVLLFDSILVANTSASNADITISQYANATNTGTAFRIANTITVPAKSTLVVVSKTNGVNLREAQSLYVTASVANALHVVAYWKEFA
jgi:sugar lactone lactonase YvrE